MRVRALDGDAKHFAREHVAGGVAAADDRRARAVDARVRPLRAPQAKFQNAAALRGLHHAAGLGGDERLMVDDVEQRGFDELRLEDRRAHADQRLAGEHDGALGHGVNIARKAEIAQRRDELRVEQV